MFARQWLKATVPLALVTALFASAQDTGKKQTMPDESGRLRVVLMMDTEDPDIGESVKVDAKNLESLFQDAFEKHKDRLEITKLAGKDFNTKALLAHLTTMKIDPADTLLVYFSCHGVTDPQRGHLLVMRDPAGKTTLVPRARVRELMQAKNPRLAILLSDSCANLMDTETPRSVAKPDWKVIQSLFFKPRGLVDLNSVSEGESANCDSKRGGIFTRWFTFLLRAEFSKLNPSSDEQVHWHDLIPQLQVNAQGSYALARRIHMVLYQQAVTKKEGKERQAIEESLKFLEKQPYQTIKVFHLPSQWRFGARLLENDGFGVRVAFVYPGTPAEAAELKAGDIILNVGTSKVTSLDTFFQAFVRAKGAVPIEFQRDKKGNQTTIKLPNEPGTSQDF